MRPFKFALPLTFALFLSLVTETEARADRVSLKYTDALSLCFDDTEGRFDFTRRLQTETQNGFNCADLVKKWKRLQTFQNIARRDPVAKPTLINNNTKEIYTTFPKIFKALAPRTPDQMKAIVQAILLAKRWQKSYPEIEDLFIPYRELYVAHKNQIEIVLRTIVMIKNSLEATSKDNKTETILEIAKLAFAGDVSEELSEKLVAKFLPSELHQQTYKPKTRTASTAIELDTMGRFRVVVTVTDPARSKIDLKVIPSNKIGDWLQGISKEEAARQGYSVEDAMLQALLRQAKFMDELQIATDRPLVGPVEDGTRIRVELIHEGHRIPVTPWIAYNKGRLEEFPKSSWAFTPIDLRRLFTEGVGEMVKNISDDRNLLDTINLASTQLLHEKAGSQRFAPKIDSHTHYAGAPSGNDLIEGAIGKHLCVTHELLKARGVKSKQTGTMTAGEYFNGILTTERMHGVACFSHERAGVDLARLTVEERRKFAASLEIGMEPISFDKMEELYNRRRLFSKDIELFEEYLWRLAFDYKANEIELVELSTSLKPAWVEIGCRVVPEIEKVTGVKLRFLASLGRLDTVENLKKDSADAVAALESCPYIVGVDVNGPETNKTRDVGWLIEDFARLKRTRFSELQIRIHAGESRECNHELKDNIKEAIELGATRIGHALFGVTPETVLLAEDYQVIVEINMSSNYALSHVKDPLTEFAGIWLWGNSKVPIFLGTDGHGLYGTLPGAAEGVYFARFFSKRRDVLGRVKVNEEAYIASQDSWIQSRINHSGEHRSFRSWLESTWNALTDFSIEQEKKDLAALRADLEEQEKLSTGFLLVAEALSKFKLRTQ